MPSTQKRPGTRRRGQTRRTPGPVYSEAARRLWSVLDEMGLETSEAAARVGVTDATVLRWLYGDKCANGERLLACHREFGLDPSLWFKRLKGKHAKSLPVSRLARVGVAA